MSTDTEIKLKAFEILFEHMGSLDTEKFISIIKRDNFDYTEWRKNLPHYASLAELSEKAMKARNQDK